LSEAKALGETLVEHGYEPALILLPMIAFVSGNGEAFEAIDVPPGHAAELDWYVARAQAAFSFGKVARGRHLFQICAATADRLSLRQRVATVLQTEALWEAELEHVARSIGRLEAARRQQDALLHLAMHALVRARAGDVTGAREMADELARTTSPGATLLMRVGLPRTRATVALQEQNPARALEELEVAAPFEYGTASLWPGPGVSGLGVFHLRGRACLMLKDGPKAAAEFQKILDNPGLAPLSPYYALAPLNLGRAYVLAGDLPRAREAYRRFLDRWKGADADLLLLREAKAEYARLGS
jgi:tetratricopeptide (TPR) repeat protein